MVNDDENSFKLNIAHTIHDIINIGKGLLRLAFLRDCGSITLKSKLTLYRLYI